VTTDAIRVEFVVGGGGMRIGVGEGHAFSMGLLGALASAGDRAGRAA
jgi:hypothetical protein